MIETTYQNEMPRLFLTTRWTGVAVTANGYAKSNNISN